ncbi:ATP-binding cassette domain-containing protein [Pantoea cypripedii]|uniref:Sugar ABC transporter n=1 Tax=Pantoea cypripedii TaxID=55209 RepID=A0A6B9GAQ6_PANCY|nr:ATP-binding cassette domain-containing protein [Pantoea cypripedii]QGY32913.1 sugar ABC transporter [Pantoea cypripedii]
MMELNTQQQSFDAASVTDIGSQKNKAALQMVSVSKTYGTTKANADVNLHLNAGEILGLVGGNGAGKSTLMKILTGVVPPDSGNILLDNTWIGLAEYDANEARRLGIRIVHQELSLCDNLTVADNFFIESPSQAASGLGWKKPYIDHARDALDLIFPNHGINVESRVENLSISQRQMVEIVRAITGPGARIVVLDEPTSSLDKKRSAQFRHYILRKAAEGMAFILISHKLQEIVETCDRVMVMRNGRDIPGVGNEEITVPQLISAMGGQSESQSHERRARRAAAQKSSRVIGRIEAPETVDNPIELRTGEIIGLAGLEGAGQRTFLRSWYEQQRQTGNSIAYVSGDRQKEGIFPLWSVLTNITFGQFVKSPNLCFLGASAGIERAEKASQELKLDQSRFSSLIGDLSGGNQQKALVARALVGEGETILFDDPTRGVDVAAKDDFYETITNVVNDDKLVLWYSTEDIEFLECDRVLVFKDGRIVRVLENEDISLDAIISSSFSETTTQPKKVTEHKRSHGMLTQSAPLLGLIIMFVALGVLNPAAASLMGVDLLLTPSIVLVLVALAQMFVVGGSEIDLSVGAFTGLINVLTAMYLVDNPGMAILAVTASLIVYASLGTLIQRRKIPSIVLTLGSSFVWAGTSYTLQPVPGGSSPEWLSNFFAWHIAGFPGSVILIIALAVIAVLIDRSRMGVALRGFGGNAAAMSRTGWSATKYAFLRYGIAGVFGVLAGFALTGISGASDLNSSSSLTLVSVAAVVVGGSALMGGMISPVGAVAGALILALTGALLGALNIDTDFNAAVQGCLLITMLVVQTLLKPKKRGA